MIRNIYFFEKGFGKPLILIHGLGLNHSIWEKNVQSLYSCFRVILPDMRAHGKSFSSSEGFTMRDMGEDVVRIMDQLNIPSAIIVGHSMGGYIALSILENFPERIYGIALIASQIYADLAINKKQRIKMAEQLIKEKPSDVFYEMPDKLTQDRKIRDSCRKMINQTDAAGMRRVLIAMASRPSSKELWKRNTKPSIIIAGKEDCFISIETINKMRALNKQTEIHLIESAGHMVMMEKPEITSQLLSTWAGRIR